MVSTYASPPRVADPLANWIGPFYPGPITQLQAEYDRVQFSLDQLEMTIRVVAGYVCMMHDMPTDKGYRPRAWAIFKEYEGPPIIVMFPKRRGNFSTRHVAVYVQAGAVSRAQDFAGVVVRRLVVLYEAHRGC